MLVVGCETGRTSLPDFSGQDLALVSPDGAICHDPCAAPNAGLVHGCARRFAYGTNWAWHHFGADFGGVAAWGQAGVAASTVVLDPMLAQMKADGVSVVRWWMFPRLHSDGLAFSTDGTPTGLSGTVLADLEAALALAAAHDLYLVLDLFSFDGFTPTRSEAGRLVPGLRPLIVDAGKRHALVERVVAPLAAAVEASPNRGRLLAWDLINEPEWAIDGPSLHGDPDFEAQADLESVSHAEMETFLKDVAATLRAHSTAPLTVGSAAIKWAKAWSALGLDFYSLHYYGWVYEWFPLTQATLARAGLTDRPVVLGELPNAGLDAIPSANLPALGLGDIASQLWDLGYAGMWSWAYNDPAFPWDGPALRSFASTHACETRF